MHTACAPIANALTMSLPRRKPLSIRIGMRPPRAPTISGTTSMVALTPSSTRPPWFETTIASIPASVASFASSWARIPLSTSLTLTVSRKRLIRSQVRLGTIVVLTPPRSMPVKFGLRQVVVEAMTASAVAGVGAPQSDKSLPFRRRSHIQRHHDRGCARGLCPLDQTFGNLPALRGVELKPYRRAARGDGILDRGRRDGGQNLQMVAGFRGLGDGDLRIGMKGAVAAGRRNNDRAVVFRADDLGADVAFAGVDEPARAQLEFLENLAVGTQGYFVIDACGHVTEMRRRNVLLHHRLEVENVKRLRGIGNQFVEVARGPVCRIRWMQCFRHGAACEQRARSQELQQPAAANDVNMMRRHRCLPKGRDIRSIFTTRHAALHPAAFGVPGVVQSGCPSL